MRVVVTAGGTREPIDAVRVVANLSTGRLGARIAEALHEAGHGVVLLRARDGARPAVPVADEPFSTSAELAALLRRHAPEADAVVHAAAVSDYVPVPRAGKLPSDAPELLLRLVRAPKLVDGLRELAPRALLVGFKLTADLEEEQALARGRELLHRARLDLVVVNDARRLDEGDHEAVLLAEEGVLDRPRGKPAIARALVAALQARWQEVAG